jgi:hypothetical protein
MIMKATRKQDRLDLETLKQQLSQQQQEKEFIQNWCSDLLDAMETELDLDSQIRLMQACGRGCFHRFDFKQDIAHQGQGSLEKLINAYKRSFEIWQEDRLVHIRYGEISSGCYCPAARFRPAKPGDLHCESTRTTHQSIFEKALGRPFKVDIVESLRRGGKTCHFVVYLVMILALLLSSCKADLTATPILPSATIMPTSTPAATAAVILEETQPPLLPMSTVLVLPISTPTYTPWTITQGALEWGLSTDERWVWAMETGQRVNDREYRTTHFASQDKQVEWLVQPDPDDPGQPAGAISVLRPLFWMPKEPYVFLVGESCCQDEPQFFSNGQSLYRLNLVTGQFSMIYPWGLQYHFSFSPNGKYLLTAYNGSQEVSVMRLRDGNKVRITLPDSYDSAGNAIWAPDGLHALLRACDHAQEFSCQKTPLVIIDPEQTALQTMVSDLYQALEMGEGDMENIRWEDASHIRLYGPKFDMVFDVTTGELRKMAK